MQTANWLVSRELTEAAGPWDTRLLGDDDGEYFCRVLLQAAGIVFVAGAKSYYRSVGESQLSEIGRSNAKLEAQFLSNELHIKYLRSLEDSERSRVAAVRYLQKYMFDFYPERPDIVQKARELAQGLGNFIPGAHDVPDLPGERGHPDPFGPRVRGRKRDLDGDVRVADDMHARSDRMRAHLGDGADRSVRRARRRRHLKAQIRLLARVGQAEGPHGRIHFPTVLDFQMHLARRFGDIGPHLRLHLLRVAAGKDKHTLGQVHRYRRHDGDRQGRTPR